MKLPHMNLKRAQELLKEKGIDVLVGSSPKNSYYASGYKPWADEFGPIIVVVPADPTMGPTMTLSGFIEGQSKELSYIDDIRPYRPWMPIVPEDDLIRGTARALPKPPTQYAIKSAIDIISESIREKGLQNGVIAIEKDLMIDPEAQSALRNGLPKAKFVEAESIFFELRKIKSEEEIKALKVGAALTVKAIQAVFKGEVAGKTMGELQLRYKRGVMQAATADNAMWIEALRPGIAAGDYFKSLQSQEFRVSKGDIIWLDGGLVVFGYTSDMARTFSVGKPGDLQKKIFTTLKGAFEEALSSIKPGVKMKDVHKIIHDGMHKGGYDWYQRGHCGHSLGIGPGKVEEPPFISADSEAVFEPNMVVCVECGCYTVGRFGAFQIEETLHITSDGYEIMTKALPRDMVEV